MNGWALSPAATLFGVNSDVGAKFLSVMSVFLARVEADGKWNSFAFSVPSRPRNGLNI